MKEEEEEATSWRCVRAGLPNCSPSFQPAPGLFLHFVCPVRLEPFKLFNSNELLHLTFVYLIFFLHSECTAVSIDLFVISCRLKEIKQMPKDFFESGQAIKIKIRSISVKIKKNNLLESNGRQVEKNKYRNYERFTLTKGLTG